MKVYTIKQTHRDAEIAVWVRLDSNRWLIIDRDGKHTVQPISLKSGYTQDWEPSRVAFDVLEDAT